MRKIIPILTIALLLFGCGTQPKEKVASQVIVSQVVSASLPQNLQLTGTLTPVQETVASAKTSGRIAVLLTDSGDRVSQGQTIARLDANTESAIVSSVSKNLKSAENNLKTIADLYEERITNAKKNLESLKKSSEKGTDLSETQLETAKNDLKREALSTLTNSAIVVQNSIDTLDQILGVSVENRNLNDSYENFLGVTNSSTKNEAENTLQKLINQNKTFYPNFENEILKTDSPSVDILDKNLADSYSILTQTKLALEKTYTMLINSSTSSSFPESQLSSLKKNVSDIGESVETLILTTQKIRGDNGVASQIAILESQLGKTKADVSTQVIQAELQIANLQKERDAKIAEAQSLITQFQGELGIQGTALANTVVTAPISGIIIEKLAESGQVVSPGLPIFKIANDSKMKVVLSVPDTAVASLSLGREAIITVDSLPEDKFQGQISKIAPSADPTSKKVDVEIEINNSNKKLKSGMFARAEFTLSSSEGVIIPQSALISRYNQNYVFVVKDNTAKKRLVKPGSQSGESVAITTGLSEGEIVINKGHLYLRDGDHVELINSEQNNAQKEMTE